MYKHKSNGFTHLFLFIAILVTCLVLSLVFRRTLQDQKQQESASVSTSNESRDDSLLWGPQRNGGWEPIADIPDCPEPLTFMVPVDLEKVTSVLYPGQYRGGEYKPHGGFRFDNSANNEIAILSPMDGFVVSGARYLAEGEIQYVFDFINNCGITWRFGHLRELTPKYAALAEKFREPQEQDSRDQGINPPVPVKAGEKIATAVGLTRNGEVNTFVDWGVYDLRQTNEAWNTEESYRQGPGSQWGQKGQHAVCWFSMLPARSTALIKALPAADYQSGSQSDYCK